MWNSTTSTCISVGDLLVKEVNKTISVGDLLIKEMNKTMVPDMSDSIPSVHSGTRLVITLGHMVVYDADVLPTLWWFMLLLGSCANFVALAIRLTNMAKDPYQRKMTYCSAVFIVACAVRSVWPRVDVERMCFWDSSISVTFVGRVLATVAEICFAAQASMTVAVLAQQVNLQRTQKLADVYFWAICMAQCCCWMGVTTQRQIWHGLEESIWAMTYACIAVSLGLLYQSAHEHVPKFRSSNFFGISDAGEHAYAKRCMAFGCPISCAYVTFMVFIDVPMYLARYRADEARGASYLWVSEGLLDSMTCSRVSKSMDDWAPEMPWMTGYFLGATAVSLWLSWGPTLHLKSQCKLL